MLRRVIAKCDITNDEITEGNEYDVEKDDDNVNVIQETIIDHSNRKTKRL